MGNTYNKGKIELNSLSFYRTKERYLVPQREGMGRKVDFYLLIIYYMSTNAMASQINAEIELTYNCRLMVCGAGNIFRTTENQNDYVCFICGRIHKKKTLSDLFN